jgi:hypothetical protein
MAEPQRGFNPGWIRDAHLFAEAKGAASIPADRRRRPIGSSFTNADLEGAEFAGVSTKDVARRVVRFGT